MESKYKKMLDTIIDDMCENESVDYTIWYLNERLGFSKEDLTEWLFDEKDVERVLGGKKND